ncbi:MAG: SDR family oxidoreductase [Thermotogaceae bacterium]|nr:SDR family oxidoreductase [Thermotogaceae bacterium]
MKLGIKGKVAVVTAASKGIGFAVAKEFAKEGVNLVINSRDKENLKKAREILEKYGVDVLTVDGDLRNDDTLKKIFNSTIEKFGKADILFLNAGGPKPGGFFDVTAGDWEESFKLNFLSAQKLSTLFAPKMEENKWGRIIYLTSISVRNPIPNLILSNGIRMAVTGMMKTLSRELAPFGVTVNAVAPGYTLTDRVKQLIEDTAKREGISFEEALEKASEKIPMKRMGKPEEIAAVVIFLASERAAFLTGQTIVVDGGQDMTSV